jgi:hypothetical protein
MRWQARQCISAMIGRYTIWRLSHIIEGSSSHFGACLHRRSWKHGLMHRKWLACLLLYGIANILCRNLETIGDAVTENIDECAFNA